MKFLSCGLFEFPWTNQGVYKRAGIMGGYEHRKRGKLKKFHGFATNARRVRLESPRDFVGGGGGTGCSETGMESGFADGKIEITQPKSWGTLGGVL